MCGCEPGKTCRPCRAAARKEARDLEQAMGTERTYIRGRIRTLEETEANKMFNTNAFSGAKRVHKRNREHND